MGMQVAFSSQCLKQIQKIKKFDSVLFRKIQKQLQLFQQKSDHPSLRLHKLSGSQEQCWSISIDMSYRLLFYYRQNKGNKEVVFFNFGTHDEVYK
jgi:addiction module RelE/StbE family toxin